MSPKSQRKPKTGEGRPGASGGGLQARVLIVAVAVMVVGAAGALAVVSSGAGGSGSTATSNDRATATPEASGSKQYGVPTNRDAAQNLANPYKEDAAFLAAGEKMYKTSCVTCHGAKGELPAAHPFNLHSAHHSDGDYMWILTFGLPETPMAPQGKNLTLQERWQLVRYIRTKYLSPADHNHQ